MRGKQNRDAALPCRLSTQQTMPPTSICYRPARPESDHRAGRKSNSYSGALTARPLAGCHDRDSVRMVFPGRLRIERGRVLSVVAGIGSDGANAPPTASIQAKSSARMRRPTTLSPQLGQSPIGHDCLAAATQNSQSAETKQSQGSRLGNSPQREGQHAVLIEADERIQPGRGAEGGQAYPLRVD